MREVIDFVVCSPLWVKLVIVAAVALLLLLRVFFRQPRPTVADHSQAPGLIQPLIWLLKWDNWRRHWFEILLVAVIGGILLGGPLLTSGAPHCSPCDASIRDLRILLHYSPNNEALMNRAEALLRTARATVNRDPKGVNGPQKHNDYIVYSWDGNRPDLANVVLRCLSQLETFRKEGTTGGLPSADKRSWFEHNDIVVYLIEY